MKSILILSAALAVAGAVSAHEEKKIVVVKEGEPAMQGEHDGAPMEKVPVTFLGVETEPAGAALAAQLGLDAGMGLVVSHVVPNSGAAAVLKKHDVVTKFDDQILVDSHQLGVLVRAHKDGDEIALTIFRGGKTQVVRVKLGHREVPKISLNGKAGRHEMRVLRLGSDVSDGAIPIPEPSGEDYDHAMRLIGRDRATWFAAPPVHVFRHEGGPGSTVLSLADGNFVFSDDTGSVEVTAKNGKRDLTVKNKKGEVTFQGPINSDEERKKIPADVVSRLDRFESVNVRYELDDDVPAGVAAEDDSTPAAREIGHPAPPY
ncbi:MAG TPA: PDZ domain-containing protein [Candidatus Didemnitutus sp.]|jgi:hypothetical protein